MKRFLKKQILLAMGANPAKDEGQKTELTLI